MIKMPSFVTLTGADDSTSINDMERLSEKFSNQIEWGILFSEKNHGHGRYPSLEFIKQVQGRGLRLAAHICGKYSEDLVNFGTISRLDSIFSIGGFQRVQVNTSSPKVNPEDLNFWAQDFNMTAILQSRSIQAFPKNRATSWLFDASGGHGKSPDAWPTPPADGTFCGYAGGIGPENVVEVVKKLSILPGQSEYWIDMESSLRDSNDHFDLKKGQVVMEALSEYSFRKITSS